MFQHDKHLSWYIIGYFNIKCCLTSIGIPIIKLRWLWDLSYFYDGNYNTVKTTYFYWIGPRFPLYTSLIYANKMTSFYCDGPLQVKYTHKHMHFACFIGIIDRAKSYANDYMLSVGWCFCPICCFAQFALYHIPMKYKHIYWCDTKVRSNV